MRTGIGFNRMDSQKKTFNKCRELTKTQTLPLSEGQYHATLPTDISIGLKSKSLILTLPVLWYRFTYDPVAVTRHLDYEF